MIEFKDDVWTVEDVIKYNMLVEKCNFKEKEFERNIAEREATHKNLVSAKEAKDNIETIPIIKGFFEEEYATHWYKMEDLTSKSKKLEKEFLASEIKLHRFILKKEGENKVQMDRTTLNEAKDGVTRREKYLKEKQPEYPTFEELSYMTKEEGEQRFRRGHPMYREGFLK